MGKSTAGQAETLKVLKDTWREMVPTFRVLCLSAVRDATTMWNHYADGYKGVVLRFFAVSIPAPGRRPGDSELFGEYGFHPSELTAIYFGRNCSDEDRSDLLKLLAHGLEHVQAHEVFLNVQEAKIESRAIGS
jgi:hypothetical protein